MNAATPSPDVVRSTRAYLVAMLPAADVPDAWHDVLDDVRYWGDTAMRPVLTVAHSVVQQRQPATEEARLLALVEDAGVADDADLAAIMGVSEERIAELRAALREFAADADDGTDATTASAHEARAAAVPVAVTTTPADADPAPATAPPRRFEVPRDEVDERPTTPTPTDGDTQRVRIGFDQDDPVAWNPEAPLTSGPPRTRILLAWAFGIWIVVAILTALVD